MIQITVCEINVRTLKQAPPNLCVRTVSPHILRDTWFCLISLLTPEILKEKPLDWSKWEMKSHFWIVGILIDNSNETLNYFLAASWQCSAGCRMSEHMLCCLIIKI